MASPVRDLRLIAGVVYIVRVASPLLALKMVIALAGVVARAIVNHFGAVTGKAQESHIADHDGCTAASTR